MTTSHNDALDEKGDLEPGQPRSEERAASAILNNVLAQVAVLEKELRAIAETHPNEAPVSSLHVDSLRTDLARTVIQWIARWPDA